MKRIWVFISALLFLVIAISLMINWQCGREVEEQSAWEKFADRNLEYHPDQFIKYIKADDSEAVGLYIEVGIDPNIPFGDGTSPIIVASAYSSKNVVRKLIQAGANVNTIYKNEVTPLLATLLGKSALSPEATAQMVTVHKADTTVLKLLLDAGANINADSYTLMMLSIRQALQSSSDFSILKILIRAGLDVNQTPKWAKPCLVLALEAFEYGLSDQALKILLKAGADPNARSQSDPKISAIELSQSNNFIEKVGPYRASLAHQILVDAGAGE